MKDERLLGTRATEQKADALSDLSDRLGTLTRTRTTDQKRKRK